MTVNSFSLLAAAALFSSLPTPASAQNPSNSSLEGCPPQIQQVANGELPVNSTGSTAFSLGALDPWHLSLILSDHRAENAKYGRWETLQELAVYLSVPESIVGTDEGNNTRFCAYVASGLNEASDAEPGEDGSQSCNGVLSDECLRALRSARGPEEDGCPLLNVPNECNAAFSISTSTPHNFSSAACTLDDLPNINLPDNYRTYGGFVAGQLNPPDSSKDSFKVYDLRVRQPVPVVITARGQDDERHAEVLCLAPSNVTEGSRVPEGDFPPSAADTLWSGRVGIFALFVACLVGLVLV